MSYKILSIPPFDKQLKRLAKKYPSLKNDFQSFLNELEGNPFMGTSLGKNCYKVRISIASKGKGKSGGARVIINIVVREEVIYMLAIYDKGEKETLTDNELRELLKMISD